MTLPSTSKSPERGTEGTRGYLPAPRASGATIGNLTPILPLLPPIPARRTNPRGARPSGRIPTLNPTPWGVPRLAARGMGGLGLALHRQSIYRQIPL